MTPLDHARHAAAANQIEFNRFVVIQDTNNLVAWLQPAPVIVKVGRWSHGAPGLLREHTAAGHLAARGVAVAEPVGDPFSEPSTSMVSTLWTRLHIDREFNAARPSDMAACLATVHAALSDVAIDLPDYREWLDLAAGTLFDDGATDRLDKVDRDLLRASYEQLRPQIDDWQTELRPIHGEPHTGNFLTAETGLHLIDFETVCRGPIEWDLASLSADVAEHFDALDDELLEVLRVLNSIRVATWCALIPADSMRKHQAHHVGVVRAHFDGGIGGASHPTRC